MTSLKYCSAVKIFDNNEISNNQPIVKKLIKSILGFFLSNFVLIPIRVELPFFYSANCINPVLDHYFPDYLIYQPVYKQHTTI